MAFEKFHDVYFNEDESVGYDPNDGCDPIQVETDGWMSLDCAKELHRDLGFAIAEIEKLTTSKQVSG